MLIPNIIWGEVDDFNPERPARSARLLVANEQHAFDPDLPAALVLTVRLVGRNVNGVYWDFEWVCEYEDDPTQPPSVVSESAVFTVTSSDLNIAWYQAMIKTMFDALDSSVSEVIANG